MTGSKGKYVSRRGTAHEVVDAPPPDAFDLIAKDSGKPRAEVVEVWTERAAIRQHVGGLPRAEADLRALDDTREVLGAQRRLL